MSMYRATFAAAGLDPATERLYRRVLPLSGQSTDACAAALEVDHDALAARLAPLTDIGAVEIADGIVRVHPAARLMEARVAHESTALRESAARLDQLRRSIPMLRDLLSDPFTPGALAEGELLHGGDVPSLLESWIRDSTGDLLWMRPDQWRLPSEPGMKTAVGAAVATGRRSRAIYPARVLEEAPQVILDRMEMGEEIRIVAEVPSRMAIVGDAGVLLPEVWGESNDRRLRVRQPALRGALTALFDETWDRGIALGPRLSGGSVGLGAEQSRRLLLAQLAEGAKDEQIARAMGLSLRTIRRRVADLMFDLGVGSRFQAGVEAVRRGLI